MSARDAAELKGLQVRLQKARADADNAKAALSDAQRKANEAGRLVSTLEEQVRAFTADDPVVTEHALLRYCERILGIDLEAAKSEILSPSRLAIVRAMGTGKVDMPGGRKLVFKNRAVVTIE